MVQNSAPCGDQDRDAETLLVEFRFVHRAIQVIRFLFAIVPLGIWICQVEKVRAADQSKLRVVPARIRTSLPHAETSGAMELSSYQLGSGRCFSHAMKSIAGGVPPNWRNLVAHWERWPWLCMQTCIMASDREKRCPGMYEVSTVRANSAS